MKIIFKIILLSLISLNAFSQSFDSIISEKFAISARIKTDEYSKINKDWDRFFITNTKDTLERHFDIRYSIERGHLLFEYNTLNGEVNGPSIGYHLSGRIYSINYYLNGKIWETNLLVDSFGNQHYPGNLINGTGKAYNISEDGHDLGYITFKNGNTDGEFYQINKEGTSAKKGQLIYREEFVKKDTITVINFINKNNDTLSAYLYNGQSDDSISNDFLKLKESQSIKILKETKILNSPQKENKYLTLFLDAGVVPIGEWRWFNPKENDTYVIYKFSIVGKLEKMTNFYQKLITEFNEDGSIRTQYKIPN